MVRHTRKRKHGGMQANPAAAGSGSSSVSANNLASMFAGLDLGIGLNASEYDMDIDDQGAAHISYDMEIDAFGSDAERREAIFEGVRLLCFPLNEDIHEYTTAELDNVLEKVNYIHCKAFGYATTIARVDNQLQYAGGAPLSGEGPIVYSSLCMLCSDPPVDAAAVAAGAGRPQGDIIIMFIVNIYGPANELVDIWSVAKNPHIAFPNAFQRLLRAFLEVNASATRFYLIVGTDNTTTMTEQGRLRLYTSLGFLIQGAQTVQLIYPTSPPLRVNSHNPANRGQLRLAHSGLQYCSFLGNIQSSTTGPIVMMATREDLQLNHSFTLGFTDSLRGRSAYLRMPTGQISEVSNRLTDNERIPIDVPQNTLLGIKALYHMGLQNYTSRTNPGNSFIQAFTVPDDFLIFTVTSPGSYLYVAPNELETFTSYIAQQMTDPAQAGLLIYNNKSTQKHPIINLYSENSYREYLSSSVTRPEHCGKQTEAGFLTSKIMEQLGRQPIFEFPLPPGAPGGATKFQMDFQLFGPGMKIFNFNMNRSSTAPFDLATNFGTYVINPTTDPISFDQNTDDHGFTNNVSSLRNYLDFIRISYPIADAAAGPKYFLFLYGCSGLSPGQNQYDLLYELSHRRSVKFIQDQGLTFDDPDFIQAAVFNKMNLDQHPCGPYGDGTNLRVRLAGGKRRKHTRKQTKRKAQRRKTRKQ